MLPVYPAASAPLEQLLVPVLALALSYFTINSWLIAVAVAFERNTSAIETWRRHFRLCLAGDGNRSKELGLYNFLGYDITHAWSTSARDRRATNATS